MFGEAFVVSDGAAAAVDPGKCSLHHPSAGQHGEPDLSGELGDNVYGQSEHGAEVDRAAGIAAVDPDHADALEATGQCPQQQLAAVAVLHAGAGDQQPARTGVRQDHYSCRYACSTSCSAASPNG